MNLIERLVSGYPQGDVSAQDFIDHLSIGADGWVGAWVAVGLAIIFGMMGDGQLRNMMSPCIN